MTYKDFFLKKRTRSIIQHSQRYKSSIKVLRLIYLIGNILNYSKLLISDDVYTKLDRILTGQRRFERIYI